MEKALGYSIPKSKTIQYPPHALASFSVYAFEWIDNLHFLKEPSELIDGDPAPYIGQAKESFLEFGWEGNGSVQLLWLPPFVFPLQLRVPPEGVLLWHVKQEEDGTSFILSPIDLPFAAFGEHLAAEEFIQVQADP